MITSRARTLLSTNVLCFQKREDFSSVLGGLPQLSRHSMFGDGERSLGSYEVVAGVMAMSAHLTQDAGRTHTAREKQKHQYETLIKLRTKYFILY